MSTSCKVRCDECESVLNIPSKYAGKKVRCPKCQAAISVPAVAGSGLASPPPPPKPQPEKPRRTATTQPVRKPRAKPVGAAPVPTVKRKRRPAVKVAMDDVDFLDDDEDEGFLDDFDDDDFERDSAPRPRSRKPVVKKKKRGKAKSSSAGGGDGSYGAWGSIGVMVLAVVWFVVGWMGGRIFFYPPIMFIFGAIGLVKSLMSSD